MCGQLDRELIEWADIIFVMEQTHRTKLRQRFRSALKSARDLPRYSERVRVHGRDACSCWRGGGHGTCCNTLLPGGRRRGPRESAGG
ncbi:MAG: hypothetical protein E6G87_00020 [Alphaproteobacteria bacterium]|nr:MAG: hypothetical protein E6G87_00020 [Alphaproteobacteria bacterium]